MEDPDINKHNYSHFIFDRCINIFKKKNTYLRKNNNKITKIAASLTKQCWEAGSAQAED